MLPRKWRSSSSNAVSQILSDIIDWSIQEMAKGFPASTGDIYRSAGDARMGSDTKSWSVILKLLVWVDRSDRVGSDVAADPQSMANWKREAVFYESDVFDWWDGDFVPAHCYRIDVRGKDSISL